MSSISETFARLRHKGKRALIPFITAGDPNLQTTRDLLVELGRAGADIIELGVPFSDPVADGPVIQRASMRALRNDVGVADILEVVKEARQEMSVPIVLFSYLNPLLQFGLDQLAEEARRAGVDGVLVTDLALEEAGDLKDSLANHAIDLILLVAPTTNDQRLRMIAENAGGFIYAVSRMGVTGTRTEMSVDARNLVSRVRAVSDLPIAVGFGISSRDQVSEVWDYADAAVVGSAIVAEVERLAGKRDLPALVGKFMHDLLPLCASFVFFVSLWWI
ncbi:MAG: tryptophan synthase subunit alpha [Acidobacteriota bacterium]